jgi:glucose-6-phosphate isomerase
MSFRLAIPSHLRSAFDQAASEWNTSGSIDRFWRKDPTLWTRAGEEKWLGWIDIVERRQNDLQALSSLAADVKAGGFESAVLFGMGGSSLCPEVLSLIFGLQAGFPALHVLDSTSPAQVKTVRDRNDPAKTLFIVASKSGSTLEPNLLKQYFFEETKKRVGDAKAGRHFIAITDPGSKTEKMAKSDNFRHIFYGDPEIGGRYSALSNFGVVPAAVAGLDVARLLNEAGKAMAAARQPLDQNPGMLLGLLLGAAHNAGRDKITFFTSPEISDLGAWLEQLIAESTGKLGKGITPVDREQIGAPEVYGDDRVFAYLRLAGTSDSSFDARVAELESAGHPVVHFEIARRYEIFGQFFTWEVATAVAASVMGINPFDQPDVESAKAEARALTSTYEETGKLPERAPIFEDSELKLFASEAYAKALKASAPRPTLTALLRAHLSQLHPHDYFAALAFLPMFPEHQSVIQGFRHKIRDAKKVATCMGFGPRFQHSTGQDYKGGPNIGVFLQITSENAVDIQIPGRKYSFGVVLAAQAAADLAVLESRGRRILRVHLGADIAAGLATLSAAIDTALA